MYYITAYTDDVLNTTNNETAFTELRRVFEEVFNIKFQEGYVIQYLLFWVCKSPLGFIIDKTDNLMELANKNFPTEKFRKFDTPFRTDSTYENDIMSVLPLTVNSLSKS